FVIEYRRRQEARPDDPLFVDQEGKQWKKGSLLRLMRKDLKHIGIRENEGYGLHSMRVGGTQWMLRAGVERFRVQLYGRWKSNVIDRYARDVYIEDSPEYSRRVWNTGLNKDDPTGAARVSVERSEEESEQSEGEECTKGRVQRTEGRDPVGKDPEGSGGEEQWLVEGYEECEDSWLISPSGTQWL
ncbi:hypothetical protein FOZ62_019700, partial [Perkinsus olseni]